MHGLITLLRPKQWLKSGFVIVPILFARRFDDPLAWWSVLVAAVAFALMASAGYIYNDLRDSKADARHPRKRKRPLASGKVEQAHACTLMAGCVVLSLLLLKLLPPACTLLVAFYYLLSLLYTYWLKRVALLDVTVLAIFYILRVEVGCAAIGVPASAWILITVFLLALMLGFAKRYDDIRRMPGAPFLLMDYTEPQLSRLVSISSGAALLAYAIYAVEMAGSGRRGMLFSVVFVALALFRYLYWVDVRAEGGEPEDILLRDRFLQAVLLLWVFSVLLALKGYLG